MSAGASASASAPALVQVLPNHRFDEARLDAWLRANVSHFSGVQSVQQFQGGQSNPTFLVETRDQAYVLRKKPSGVLLPSAHAIDREYKVLQALAGTAVPVPPALALCEDEGIIGTSFYLMDYVPGRVFTDPTLPSCAPQERAPLYMELARTLAALHAVDWRRSDLRDFGRPERYLARQITRWSRQFATSGLQSPEMEQLTAWLAAHIPGSDADGDVCTLAHGDYRIGNVIFAAGEARILAVLDWELSTIGHPLADLAYSCLAWRLPQAFRGMRDHPDPCLPGEGEYLAAYCAASGGRVPADFEFFIAFSLFRQAAILAGVYRRALDGNAADARALDAGRRFHGAACMGWDVARAA